MPEEDAAIADFDSPKVDLALVDKIIFWRCGYIRGLLMHDRVKVHSKLLDRGGLWSANTCSFSRGNQRIPDVGLSCARKKVELGIRERDGKMGIRERKNGDMESKRKRSIRQRKKSR